MNKPGAKTIEIPLTVPFHDLDPMQVVWHGNYLKYFDIARCALFDSLGIDLYGVYKDTKYLFPVVRTSTKHIRPLRHRDQILCRATLVEAKYKIVLDFEIRLVSDGKLCAKGRGEQVAVRAPEMELEFMIPDAVREALES